MLMRQGLMKRLIAMVLLAVSLVAAVRFVLPWWLDYDRNRVVLEPPYHFSKSILPFYSDLVVADLHADTLLWGRDLLDLSHAGHLDLPRLQQANISLQVFSVVTKTPRGLNIHRNTSDSDNITLLAISQGWPWKTLGSLLERARFQSETLVKTANESRGDMKVLRNRDDLERLLEARKQGRHVTGALLSLEGAHALEGSIDNLTLLWNSGFRLIGLTHFFDNRAGGSAHGVDQQGLTDFGRKVVEKAQAMGMVIDLSHASSKLIEDVLDASHKPILVSHTGVKGTCDRSRNLDDKQILAVTRQGGLIGIGFYSNAICGHEVDDITRAIRYTVDLAGIDHVALGSDFDGAVTEPFDVTGLPLLTQSLLEHGFTRSETRKIMGENVIRFMKSNLPR